MSSSKEINRKPVQRRTFSVDSTRSPDSDTLTHSFSIRTNGSLLRPPSLRPRATTTSALLTQASRSLTNLTDDLNSPGGETTAEDPPPYVDVDPPIHAIPTGDLKRADTRDDLGDHSNPPSMILLVHENRIALMRDLLEQGVGIDDIDPITRRTAIMEAANLRRSQATQLLINSACRLHLKDVDGNTALHFAAAQGDADICALLLEAGAQLDEYNMHGQTPLDVAASGGNRDAVLCLLNSWSAQQIAGTSLLNGFLAATKSGNVSTAEAFIERGINPKKVKDSWKPIAYAAQSGSIPMLDFMLAQKCDIKARNNDRWTALHFAAAGGHTVMVERLLSRKLSWKAHTKKAEETALHLATRAQHAPTAMALILHKDANITVKDADGLQALHHAVRNGDIALTNTLLNFHVNRNAKIDEQTKYGWSPFLLCCGYGHAHLVAEFITRGINLEERLSSPSFKPGKKTNEAARKGYWAEIRWPHPSARPLHLALEYGHDEVANMLIAAGAKIEESDSEGWRPLHYAAFNCRVYMVEMLLMKGASPHATTNDGNTPLSLGFREPGLTATYEEREHVCGLLQAAMNARKKSKLSKLSDLTNTRSKKAREVTERNRIWSTAILADSLYQIGQFEDGGDEDDSLLTPATSNYYIAEEDEEGSSAPRITKTLTD